MRLLMIVTAALLAAASPALAQGLGPPGVPTYGPFQRPGLSPYLNLLRDNNANNQFGNGGAAANYFLGVLPEQQRRANATEFSQRIGELDERTRPDGPISTGTAPLPNTTRR
ncbi:MAG: hypothetical protein ACRC33_05005, partial [Gemmataceae bacterium]